MRNRRGSDFFLSQKKIADDLYELDPLCGLSIRDVMVAALQVAQDRNATVQFGVNDVMVVMRPDSNVDLIYRDYGRAADGYIDRNIGPYPSPVLTDDEIASDARIEAENTREAERRAAEYEAKKKARRKALRVKLANAPAFESGDEVLWQKYKRNKQDGFGQQILRFAEHWARLMQVELANGRKLEEIADSTFEEADTEGISGSLYGPIVATLAHYWKHGELLRRWHNLSTQLGTEGERANESGAVLNPSVIEIP